MRSFSLVALLALPAQAAFSQQTPAAGRTTTLTLEEAISTAQRNNPALHQIQNNVRNAGRAGADRVRTAVCRRRARTFAARSTRVERSTSTASRFLAEAATTTSPGTRSVSTTILRRPPRYAPRAAKAFRTAAEADVTNFAENVRALVTQYYITALQSEAQSAVLDTLVQTAAGQLNLVTAKMEAGAGTIIDIRTAEVALGQAQVASLTRAQQREGRQAPALPDDGRSGRHEREADDDVCHLSAVVLARLRARSGPSLESGRRRQEVSRRRKPASGARVANAATCRRSP